METHQETENKGSPAVVDGKDDGLVTEAEFAKLGKDDNGDVPAVTSAFATLSRSAALRKFWRLFAFGLSVSISGM